MQTLSGNALSIISHALGEVNAGNLSLEEVSARIAKLATDPDSLVELSDELVGKLTISPSIYDRSPAKYLSTADLSHLNVLLPWSSYNSVGKAAPLGGAYRAEKRASPHQIPDKHLDEIGRHIQLANMSALEVGCFEGHYTASLVSQCKNVYAIDSRIENVIKTLVRLWALKLERKATLDVVNLEDTSLAEFYNSQVEGFKGFDLVHHRGVLYHLADPCKHLEDLAAMGMNHLYLHTQYASESQPMTPYNSVLGKFDAFFYREKSIEFAPFAGMKPNAIWLKKADIFQILKEFGMSKVEVFFDREERNGSRIEFLASR